MPAAESWRLEEFRCAEKVRRDDQSAVRFIRVLYREPIIQIGEAEKPEEEEARKRIRARARARVKDLRISTLDLCRPRGDEERRQARKDKSRGQ